MLESHLQSEQVDLAEIAARVLIAYGRDAADVAISTSFGSSKLTRFKVVIEELASQNNAPADRVRSLSFA
jgi:hypothetical protein